MPAQTLERPKSTPRPAKPPIPAVRDEVLSDDEVRLIDAHWRAANYLAVGQIYLRDNPLLRRPLTHEDIKPRLLGHWGTVPGLNLVYTHLNRLIIDRGLDVLFVAGPGHGGPALFAQTYLEGSYTELHPDVPLNEHGLKTLFRQFSWPGGVPSHCGPETPGSIHEGGELGYCLSHAFGAALDNPGLLVACVVGDGEAETGPLAASWQSAKFLNPRADGAVLPILHLNGYKIANPTLLARMSDEAIHEYFHGLGYAPHFVQGDDPPQVHRDFAATLQNCHDEILAIQASDEDGVPRWPMIVLRTPKGWTGPRAVEGKQCEGSWRSHQVPLKHPATDPRELVALKAWLRSYRPEELFTDRGAPAPGLVALVPPRSRRMGLSPHAHGHTVRGLRLPDPSDSAVSVPTPGAEVCESPRPLGRYLTEVFRLNEPSPAFILVGPDETASNRLDDVFAATDRRWLLPTEAADEHLCSRGDVFEILSEHTCEGWLEGYLLTGRHGLFSCYEAFMPIVDSMVSQHAKWLKVAREVPWRRPIPSLNVLLTSHVWRQDHNGFSHQDPGFVDHVLNKKPEIVRAFFPPDANCLLHVADECLRSRDRVNVIVCGKQPSPQWLTAEQAAEHVESGVGIWPWAGTERHFPDREPDLVMACCGDVPTVETLAAVTILRDLLPDLSIRVVNVVDLAKLRRKSEFSGGLDDATFDMLFTRDRPVVFAFHGYPGLIHRLVYKRHNHAGFHVHGFQEEGSTTTPFDMLVRNDLDRFHLAANAARHAGLHSGVAAVVRDRMHSMILKHRRHVVDHGVDLPEVTEWVWSADGGGAGT